MKKRLFDFMGASAGLVVSALPMAVIAGAVKWKMGGPILFRQERLGKDSIPFIILKFRTMREFDNAAQGPVSDSDRVTALGRFLRHYRLDELPQFWNVLKGDMSLVGPRPRNPRGKNDKPFIDADEIRAVNPGLTSSAKAEALRRGAPFSTKEEVSADLAYARTAPSLSGDFAIIMKTLTHIHKGIGANEDRKVRAEELTL